MISVFLILGVGVVLLYRYISNLYLQFERDGIPGPKPTFFIGNLRDFVNVDPLQKFVELTKRYGKVFGYYEGLTPSIVVSDPVLIEQILVKHFKHFDGRPNSYPLLHGAETLALQNINGAVWKQQRDALAPVFNSSSIAQMLPRIQRSAESYVQNLGRAQAEHPEGFDVRELNQRYCLDSFMAATFEEEMQQSVTQADRDLFRVYMDASLYSASPENPVCGLARVYPALTSLLRLFDNHHRRLLHALTQRTAEFIQEERLTQALESKTPGAGSLLRYLVSAHVALRDHANNTVHVPLTDVQVHAHLVELLGGGLGTSLSTLHFCLYCLARHARAQEKLRQEVDATCPPHEHITLNHMHSMEFLDMFLNETLRHFPVAPGVARTCAEDCTVGGYHFRKGTVVRLLGSVQYMDPEVFPDPQDFRPERFSKAEREKRHVYTWFPFGSGPRMCVAKRLGVLQVKMALVRLLQNYEVRTTSRTQTPLPTALRPFLTPTGPVHLAFVSRDRAK